MNESKKEKKGRNFDLFGNEIITNPLLRDKFIEPPFSVLDSKSGSWKMRRNKWKQLGIKSELGRKGGVINGNKLTEFLKKKKTHIHDGTSIFDPALCEVMYHWFCPPSGNILDPFAGGSVRGIVANYLGYKYTGIELRQEQIESNVKQARNILDINNQPNWIQGDSEILLLNLRESYDFIFSCPPYSYLERYSDLAEDLSNMSYKDFLIKYNSIINNLYRLLNKDSFACFVVGEVRDKKGNYIGLVPDTIKAFEKAGFLYYNEIIYLQGMVGACLTAGRQMSISKKVRKIHQNVLVFKKP